MALNKYISTIVFSIFLSACSGISSNAPPIPTVVLAAVGAQSTDEDTVKTITLVGTSADDSLVTYTATSSTTNVTVSISGSTLTLTPAPDWNGTATISPLAYDGRGNSADTPFILTVTPVNDAPTLTAISNQSTDEDTAKSVTLSVADIDNVVSSLTVSATSSSSYVTPSAAGTTLTLTPSSDWHGTSTITAKVYDGSSYSTEQTFTLTVASVNDSIPLLIVRIEFTDYTFTSSEATWASKIFGTGTGQLNEYFSEISGGTFQFTPVNENDGIANNGVVTTQLSIAHPNPGKVAIGAFQTQMKTAITNIDSNVNFAAYDTNSNGSLDYKEIQIMFLVAGGESATGTNPGIWAHKSSITPGPTHDSVVLMDGTTSGTYSCFGERQWTHDATIGVIAHELGHAAWILPDLYDIDSSTAGIGQYGLMGNNWTSKPGDSYSGQTPIHMTSWSKIQTGFAMPTEVTADGTFTANDHTSSSYNVFRIESGTANEYFLIDNRNAVGYDLALASLSGADVYLGGMMISHIDENVGNNANDAQRLVDIEEANDGNNDAGGPGHVNGLFFDGNSGTFNDASDPNSKKNNGDASNVSITNVGARGATMAFTVDVP